MSKKESKDVENPQLHTVTGRFQSQLFNKMQEWMNQNGMSANQLLARAVEKYISEPQTLDPVELVSASKEDLEDAVEKVMKKHKRALDELK